MYNLQLNNDEVDTLLAFLVTERDVTDTPYSDEEWEILAKIQTTLAKASLIELETKVDINSDTDSDTEDTEEEEEDI